VTTPAQPERPRTPLDPRMERMFQAWYSGWAERAGISPDPDDPLNKYDYRGAFVSGAVPTINEEDGLYHWPSNFKDDDHPNRFVKGVGDSRAVDRMGSRPTINMPSRSLLTAPADATAVRRKLPLGLFDL
jgi:hypothetical protein